MRRNTLLFLGVFLCSTTAFLPASVSADTADIPALTGTGTGNATERFIAAWATTDGATIPAGSTQYMGMFGDSSPRTTETDVLAQVGFHYNVTNLRISANLAGCGGLSGAQTFSFALRKNGADTILQGNCTATTPINAALIDTDTVAIVPGDRLSFRVTINGAVLGVALRVGITLEGSKLIPVTVDVLTDPVVDMTNELLEVVNLLMPIVFLVLAVIWAEITKEWLVHILGTVCGIAAVLAVWTEIESLRAILIGATALVVFRGFYLYDQHKIELEKQE